MIAVKKYSFFTILYMIGTAIGSVQKVKLCVQFEMDPGHADYNILSTKIGLAKGSCFVKCVRHNQCMAFNYREQDGFCELLPAIPSCTEPVDEEGYVFVHLGDCLSHLPPTWGFPTGVNWQWEAYINNMDTNTFVPLVSTPTAYVAMVFDKGIYVPGWMRPGKSIHILSSDGLVVLCPGDVSYVLTFPAGTYNWVPFGAGEILPPNAVTGFWLYGTPLYVVKAELVATTVTGTTVATLSGYYSPVRAEASIIYNGRHHPTTMEMLVHV